MAIGDPGLGDIQLWAGSFAPRNWAFCDGRLMPIAQNAVLFTFLGTIYGGDGQTTFALPDLRGRIPVGATSIPNYFPDFVPPPYPSSSPQFPLGQQGGTASFTLTTTPAVVNTAPGIRNVVAGPTELYTLPPTLGLSYIIALRGWIPENADY